MKVENEVTYALEFYVDIDNHTITKITFDPKHINQGWSKKNRDYEAGKRSDWKEEEIANIFEELSKKSFRSIEKTKEEIKKRGVKCTRYTFTTDIEQFPGEDYLLTFVVDIFDKNFIPPFVLVTMYEPDDEEV